MKFGSAVAVSLLAAVPLFAGFAIGQQYRSHEAEQPSLHLATYTNVQYAGRMSQFSEMPDSPADVVMLGDSNTEFGEWHELLPQPVILNRGISGDTSAGVKARVAEVIRHKPRLVFLLVGVNDLAGGKEPAEVAGNIEAIVAGLGTRTVVLDVLYTANETLNGKIEILNSLLHKLPVEHLDLNHEVAPEQVLLPQYTEDGIHLNGAGYAVWRDRIKLFLSNGGGYTAAH